MLAGMAAGRINAALGLEESAAAIFRHRTVETLAEALSQKAQDDRPVPVGPIIPRDPYTSVQLAAGVDLAPKQQYWLDLVQQLQGQYPSFHIPIAVNLTGSINLQHMQRALDLLADKHESLRIQLRDGRQVVNRGRPGQMPLHSDSGPGANGVLESASKKQWLGQKLSHLLLDEFDLGQAPLARAALLQVCTCLCSLCSTLPCCRFFNQEQNRVHGCIICRLSSLLVPICTLPDSWMQML